MNSHLGMRQNRCISVTGISFTKKSNYYSQSRSGIYLLSDPGFMLEHEYGWVHVLFTYVFFIDVRPDAFCVTTRFHLPLIVTGFKH